MRYIIGGPLAPAMSTPTLTDAGADAGPEKLGKTA